MKRCNESIVIQKHEKVVAKALQHKYKNSNKKRKRTKEK